MLKTTVTPRMGDCDGLRHVNNTKLPEWFEMARNPIFRIFSPELRFETFDLIMAHLEVDFLRPLLWGEDVEIRTCVTHLGNSSFRVSQQAWQGGQQCARGQVVIVHYDHQAGRSKPLTADQRARLQEYYLSPDEFAAASPTPGGDTAA